jgi:hypothetical protein
LCSKPREVVSIRTKHGFIAVSGVSEREVLRRVRLAVHQTPAGVVLLEPRTRAVEEPERVVVRRERAHQVDFGGDALLNRRFDGGVHSRLVIPAR